MFHMDVAKVDYDVAYVAMAIHACCKSMFSMFHLFLRRMLQAFYLDVAYVSRICCKCFIWKLHIVATAFKCFQSFCKCSRRMLQVLHLDVTKVDRALHILQRDPPITAACCSC